jgi:hypothetical protein
VLIVAVSNWNFTVALHVARELTSIVAITDLWYNTLCTTCIVFVCSENTQGQGWGQWLRSFSPLGQGCFPQCERYKTSWSWPGSTRKIQIIIICLCRLLTASVHSNDQWHADQNDWLEHISCVDWFLAYSAIFSQLRILHNFEWQNKCEWWTGKDMEGSGL